MPNYIPYYANNSYYMQNLQNQRDFLDSQIKQMQQNQQPTPTNLTQNFQIAPQQQSISELEGAYAQTIDEVKNRFVSKTGIFTNKDFSTIWIKDTEGNIRTFRTEELIELDDKDKEIFMLRKEIGNLKEEIKNANTNSKYITNNDEPNESKKSTRVSKSK